MDGKTILITGGTGFFGRTMACRLRDEDVAEVRIFSRDEDTHFPNTQRLGVKEAAPLLKTLPGANAALTAMHG